MSARLRYRAVPGALERNAELAARLVTRELTVVAGPPEHEQTQTEKFDPDRLDRYGIRRAA